uniref:DffE n=1 Tax=Yersinia pestis TaxID=632 RepID=Q93AB0_YERPE|nr:DffE [Yersinia pestis]
MVRSTVIDCHDHHHRCTDSDLAVSGPRARARDDGAIVGFTTDNMADFYRQSRSCTDCRDVPGFYCVVNWHLFLPDPFRRFVGSVLRHDVALWLVSGRFWSIDLLVMLNSAAGVYWRICLYDACYFAFWLCLSGREHANLAAKYHLDQSYSSFY